MNQSQYPKFVFRGQIFMVTLNHFKMVGFSVSLYWAKFKKCMVIFDSWEVFESWKVSYHSLARRRLIWAMKGLISKLVLPSKNGHSIFGTQSSRDGTDAPGCVDSRTQFQLLFRTHIDIQPLLIAKQEQLRWYSLIICHASVDCTGLLCMPAFPQISFNVFVVYFLFFVFHILPFMFSDVFDIFSALFSSIFILHASPDGTYCPQLRFLFMVFRRFSGRTPPVALLVALPAAFLPAWAKFKKKVAVNMAFWVPKDRLSSADAMCHSLGTSGNLELLSTFCTRILFHVHEFIFGSLLQKMT